MKKILFIITLSLVTMFIIVSIIYLYNSVYLNNINDIKINLNGEENIIINLNEDYTDDGINASFRDEDITSLVNTYSNLDNKTIGDYVIDYKVDYKGKNKAITRHIKVVDNVSPTITLKGKVSVILYLNDKYKESGAISTDNYDGDLSKNIEIDSNVNTNIEGNYEVTYKVRDSSGNEASATRKVTVKKRPLVHRDGVAVLNYHFFYKDKGCSSANCMEISKFEEQLKYLKENNYKALTMQEFVDYMYGNISVPEKSVLITIDDGALGTGAHNGNLLIPALEKYEMHATLFLITGWWKIENYQSPYLDIESHSYDMHTENYCSGVSRGAKMLCLSKEERLKDLELSISITGSNKAFCYPLYVYNNEIIENVKEAGFKLAFAGGNSKAKPSSNKYAIPRFKMTGNMSLDDFIYMIY